MTIAVGFQRVENLVIALAALGFYCFFGGRWFLFFLFLLVVDVSMVDYLVNTRVGGFMYNLGHSYSLPVAILVCNYFLKSDVLYGILLIWIGHIGFDRALGYGLKGPTSFQLTHLGKIGRHKGS